MRPPARGKNGIDAAAARDRILDSARVGKDVGADTEIHVVTIAQFLRSPLRH